MLTVCSVIIDGTVNVPTTIRGGAGIDVLSGGSSRDNIDGAAGRQRHDDLNRAVRIFGLRVCVWLRQTQRRGDACKRQR